MSINTQPIINPSHNAVPLVPPNGMTADKIKQQVNENAMRNVGYIKPQAPPSDPATLHQYTLKDAQQAELQKRQKYLQEIHTLLNEELPEYKNSLDEKRTLTIQYYRNVFQELQNMKLGTSEYSLMRSVFLIENAWHDNTLDYSSYVHDIETKTNLISSIAKKDGIISNNNIGLNYIIQRLYSETITLNNNQYHPFQYDFEDYMGEKDWSKMFVTKLLKSNKGQCHSLPLLYLILAEKVGAKAWLSFAPEHSFIIFSDDSKRSFYNFETTNGNIVSNDWVMESGFINTTSIRNRIYLDTLGKDQLLSSLITDLVMGYTNKFGYDQFVEEMIDFSLLVNPKNIQAHILKADIQVLKTNQELKKVGNPPITQIKSYPDAYSNYYNLLKEYDIIDGLGYVQMPKEVYEQWLATAKLETKNNGAINK